MSLYTDILRGETEYEDDVRKDGNTWTVVMPYILNEEIPNFPSEDMALAVARSIRYAYEKGMETVSRYS